MSEIAGHRGAPIKAHHRAELRALMRDFLASPENVHRKTFFACYGFDGHKWAEDSWTVTLTVAQVRQFLESS